MARHVHFASTIHQATAVTTVALPYFYIYICPDFYDNIKDPRFEMDKGSRLRNNDNLK